MSENHALRAAYAALRANDPGRALAVLSLTGALSTQENARAHAYRAQALWSLHREDEAAKAAIEAIRWAKQAGDPDAVLGLRDLHEKISASLVAKRTAEAGKAADLRLLTVPDSTLDCDGLLRKAEALIGAGNPESAGQCAKLALALASSPRDAVLSRLMLARLTQEPSFILDAHQIADRGADENLVTAVARAAKLLGVRLPAPEFG